MVGKKKDMESGQPIVLDKIKMDKASVRIKGLTDVITHEWNRKAKWEMLVKQLHGAKNKLLSEKLPKCPLLEFAESLYWVSGRPEWLDYNLPVDLAEVKKLDEYRNLVKKISNNEIDVMAAIREGTFGFPAGGVRAAIVGACTLVDNITKVGIKLMFYCEGNTPNFIVFENEDGSPAMPYMREDMVIIGNGIADIRYRGAFKDWFANVVITYNASKLTGDTMVNLLDYAGSGGIGEWRPSAKKTASGNYGRFEVLAEKK
jgi:hypothetical protein